MSDPIKPMTDAEVRCYFEGMRAGIKVCAVTKDGKQTVGCEGYSLQAALDDVSKVEIKSLKHLERTGQPWPGCFSPRTGED